jgi:AraC family transcriptional regulator
VDLLSAGQRREILHVTGSGTAAGVRVTQEWLRRLAFDDEPSAFGLATPFLADQTVHQLVQTMCNEVARNAITGPLFAESLSLSLLSYVTRRLLSGSDDVRGTLSRAQRQRLRGHIADHLASELSLVELASMVGLGPRRFSTLFREAFGMTPHKYVVQQRLGEGARLLMEENADIAEIATRVGFCSQSHFTAAFRTAYGVTPRRYWLDSRRRGAVVV